MFDPSTHPRLVAVLGPLHLIDLCRKARALVGEVHRGRAARPRRADDHESCVDHPERYLQAFVHGHLGLHDLLRVRTDAERLLLLAALNLVERVAYSIRQARMKSVTAL